MNRKHTDETAAFIRDHRSNETHFERLYGKLEEELSTQHEEGYTAALQEIKEKSAEEYKKTKESRGTAWPEFERFATEFERAVQSASEEM